MEQPQRNVVGGKIRRLRVEREISQLILSTRCSRLGYELTRSTLAKIEAGIRAVSDVELFLIAHVLDVGIENLYPSDFLKFVRGGKIAPFHRRQAKDGGSPAPN